MTKQEQSPPAQKVAEKMSPITIVAPQQGEPVLSAPMPPEFGGRKGPEATRFGDWELNGKCVDF